MRAIVKHAITYDVNPDNFGLPENFCHSVVTPNMQFSEILGKHEEIVEHMQSELDNLLLKISIFNETKQTEQDNRNLERAQDDKDTDENKLRNYAPTRPPRRMGGRGGNGN